MNTRNLVSLALLVAIGAVLHLVVPPIFLGMKPDMLLTMMFLGIILFPDTKSVTILAVVTGIIAGMTSGFPGGAIANPIDKICTAIVFFPTYKLISKYTQSIISVYFLTAIGTIVSGLFFLTAAYFIVGLPGAFIGLVGAVVLPTAVINTIVMAVIHPITMKIFARTNVVTN